MPTDVFDHSAETDTPVDRVWVHLQDPESWRAMGGIERIADPSFDDDGRLQGFDFVSNIGGRNYAGRARTVTSEPEDRMVVDVDTTELAAQLTVELAAVDEGRTRLDVTMRVSSKSFLASMMWGLVAATVGAGLPRRVGEVIDTFD